MLILTRPLLSFHDNFARALSRESSAIYQQHNRPSHRRVRGPWTCSGRHIDALHHLEMGLLDKVCFRSGFLDCSIDMPLTLDSGPIGFVSLIIFFLSWPKAEHLPSMTRRSWKEFDYVGSFLIIAAAVLVVFAFQNAGESPAATWGTAVFIAPLTVGLVLWLALLGWGYLAGRVSEGRLAPTFPIGLFRNRAYAAAAISTLFAGYPYFIINYAFPLRAQVVDDKSPLLAGIMLLPMLGATAVGSILAGALSRTKNYLFETMLVGASLMTLGVGLLTIVHDADDDAKALAFIVFAGLGFGLNIASATMLTSVEVPIIDYGKFHRRPPKSVKLPWANQTQHPRKVL